MIHLEEKLPALTEVKTTISARANQDMHIYGSKANGSVHDIAGEEITISGLRIYGAVDNPNILVRDKAKNVIITNNIIGDEDGHQGNCGNSDRSTIGLLVNSTASLGEGEKHAWIFGKVIECNNGTPGDGLSIATDGVVVGKDNHGGANEVNRNIIHNNSGVGINLTNVTGNLISNCEVINNTKGSLAIVNFNNDLFNNYFEKRFWTTYGQVHKTINIQLRRVAY